MISDDLFKSILIETSDDFLSYRNHLPRTNLGQARWIFRGLTSVKHDLSTTLERALTSYGEPLSNAVDRERQLIREFQRRTHHYERDVPHQGDNIEWLALMQHYGAPTRLLDWTYSFYVAAFFALERANPAGRPDEGPCAIWALDALQINPRRLIPKLVERADSDAHEIQEKRPSQLRGDVLNMAQDLLVHRIAVQSHSIALHVTPFRMNERLSIQQGTFLFTGNVSEPFEANLIASNPTPAGLVRFTLPSDIEHRRLFLRVLHEMNISRASLFPGLAGFAESLWTTLSSPDLLRPRQFEHLWPSGDE